MYARRRWLLRDFRRTDFVLSGICLQQRGVWRRLFLFPFASVSFLTCPWCLVCVVSRASCTAVLIRSCYLSLYLVVGTLCLTILSVTFLCYLRDITKGFSFFSDCTLLVYWCNPPKLCNIFFLANQCWVTSMWSRILVYTKEGHKIYPTFVYKAGNVLKELQCASAYEIIAGTVYAGHAELYMSG